MYRIKFTNRGEKDLKKLSNRYLIKTLSLIDNLKTNPFLGEKMSGNFIGSYRIKIPPIRIVYTPDLKGKTILVEAIGHRQGVYK